MMWGGAGWEEGSVDKEFDVQLMEEWIPAPHSSQSVIPVLKSSWLTRLAQFVSSGFREGFRLRR